MQIKKEHMQLYIVTDRTWLASRKLSEQVEESVHAGATIVQLREKDMEFEEFVKEAKEIKALTKKYQVPFIINDNVEVAIAADADGVHLGQGDGDLVEIRKRLGSGRVIGISAHNVEEALKAQEAGADYLGVGAVFPTNTKKDANPVTVDLLKAICEVVHIPVVAIGGITKDNIMDLAGSGVDGVAVISAIFAQEDIGEATREMLALSKEMLTLQGRC